MPQPSKNYGARYSVPVSKRGASLVELELKYLKENMPGGFSKPVGQLLGEIVEEGIAARFKARGIETLKIEGPQPAESADPKPAVDHAAANVGVDPMNYPEPKTDAA